jgi:asparagine synthase (glutamine-hydrolysing)
VCGLCGFVGGGSEDSLRATVSAMADTLTHRGPDASGSWVDASLGLALGHRRLAVIDPTPDGAQPMHSSCGRYVIVYNGELYDHRALRRELEGEGRRFRGRSDTEVLVEAIGAWGVEKALSRFEGMFAFAVWDSRERQLHLVRDPLGKKPLYYARRGGALWFGSELKALRAHPDFAADLDRESLAFFLRFSYMPAPRTVYTGVGKLEAGERLVFDVTPGDGVGPARRERFAAVGDWAEAGERDPFRGGQDEALETLDALLRGAVARRLVSDVPLGALLSGGIDSSLVVALMQEQSAAPVRTFCVGYREPDHDEAGHARRIATHLGTQHTELRVTPAEARDVIPRIRVLYDEPFADTSQIPTALVCALARRHVTVALSGDGGDELFAGYPRYSVCLRRARWLSPLPHGVRHALAAGARALAPVRLERAAEALVAEGVEGQFTAACARHPADETLVLGAAGTPGRAEAPRLVDPLARLMALDLSGRLPESILVKVDRASMGVGLEVRSPLLDERVAAFALRLPAELRVRARRAKWPLRALLGRRLPAALFERPKQGFGVPIGSWLRGPLREWGDALLARDRLRAQGLLDPERVQDLWDEHQRGARERPFLVWNLLVLQAWLEAGA